MNKAVNVIMVLCLGFLVFNCTPKEQKKEREDTSGVVDILASDFQFTAPESIPSGWTTFRLENAGLQEHFLYVYRLPDNKTYNQFLEEAIVPFGSVWNEYAAGELTRSEAETKLGEEIAGWFFTDLVPSGGVALTEPGETAQATVNLEPGTYVIECYVKTPEGRWHTEFGMQQALEVTQENNGTEPPTANMDIDLTNYEITFNGSFTSGKQTVAVHVKDQPDGFMVHDLNLFRLDEETTTEDIVTWMDWMDLEQFKAPAPGYSLGGIEHLTTGRTGYMTVDLQPGNYALVSEMYGTRGMVKTFSIE